METEWGSPTNCGLIHKCHIIILVHVKRPGEEEAMNESHSEMVLIIVMMMIFISRVLLESGHSTALFYILMTMASSDGVVIPS